MKISTAALTVTALPGIPLVQPGDDLTQIVMDALERAGESLQTGDVLVVSSTIVSKAEGRIVDLKTVDPGEDARHIAQETGKDPRIVELVLRESAMISRMTKGVLVTQHRLGLVMANAGIDQSNVDSSGDRVLLLPVDPDASAYELHTRLHHATGARAGIILSDTHGRPFRMGNVGVAVGVAGMPALIDLRGKPDLFGRELQATQQGYADLVASAAHLVCGEADEGLPVVLLRGLRFPPDDGRAADLNRPPEQDLYR